MSNPTDSETAFDVHDLGDASTPVSGDVVASELEQSNVAVQRDPYAGPIRFVVVQPGDTWSALAAFYHTDIETLNELNPYLDARCDLISGVVSDFRVPITWGSR